MASGAFPEILPLGSYYPLDAEGYVRNRCDPVHVTGDWQALTDAAVACYRAQLGDRLRAVFLRGSVPAGTAVPGLSDLDLVALVQPGASFQRWYNPDWAAAAAEQLQQAYPVAAEVELMCADHDPAVPGRNPRIKMLLQTQALCCWGTDPRGGWPRYRPGPEMALHHRWLASDIAAYRAQPGDTRQLRSLLKTLIRSGFELVMVTEGQFATDLYPCLVAFGRHYPDRKAEMEMALRIFLAPELAEKHLFPLLDGLGKWLVAQLEG